MGEPQVDIYYASGAEHCPSHILMVSQNDLRILRVLRARAQKVCELAEPPDIVTWIASFRGDVVEVGNFVQGGPELSEVAAEATDAADTFRGVSVARSKVAGLQMAPTALWEVHFYTKDTSIAQVNWHAKYGSSPYNVAINLMEGGG